MKTFTFRLTLRFALLVTSTTAVVLLAGGLLLRLGGSDTNPRGDRGGHGLGLAICQSIVQLHRGTIRAENRRERLGLRLTVELPE